MSYLGIDCGSVSIKFALVTDGRLQEKIYLKNHGLIQTVKKGLGMLRTDGIRGVGVTGSGKEFVKSLVSADYIDSEIISHLTATVNRYPDVRTVLDIGGEDSKLMLVKDGALTCFQMNRDCGGGPGAMIEAIANRLEVRLEDVGEMALGSRNAVDLPGKCGIFCQSAVVSELNKGRPIPDILMGVCRALVANFLAVLAKGKILAGPIVFQGATAQNAALVRCFEEALNSPILVPQDCSFMGAIGIAELTGEVMADSPTSFRGIETILKNDHVTEISRCADCENRCELLYLRSGDVTLGISGSRCGKYNN